MTSNASVAAWQQQWATVVRQGRPDVAASRDRLALGKQHASRARTLLAANDPDGATIFAEFALVNAADAVLLRDGFRVRAQTGSHQARFSYPGLPETFRVSRQLIDQASVLRNRAAYEAGGQISQRQSIDLADLVDRTLAEVEILL